MAAVPDIDISAILAPIPGDNPGGGRMPFMVRQKLEAMRKDSEPNPEDPAGADIPKKPDWIGIIRTSAETLASTSKDLETAMRMLEALTRQSDFPGVKLGLEILRQLVESCWDYLHPIPDPEDGEGPEIRAERFNWIGDLDAGARFPHTLRQVPFLSVSGTLYSMQERTLASEGKGTISSDEMSRALVTGEMAADIAGAYKAFLDLDRALTEKLNNNAPGMIGLRQVLEEINDLAQRLAGGGGSNGEATTEPAANASATPTSGGGTSGGPAMNLGAVATREEAYRAIRQIADTLERIEPHSPIPDLLRRAIDLGRMPFRRLIKELIRDNGNLTEVYREFGIKADEES